MSFVYTVVFSCYIGKEFKLQVWAAINGATLCHTSVYRCTGILSFCSRLSFLNLWDLTLPLTTGTTWTWSRWSSSSHHTGSRCQSCSWVAPTESHCLLWVTSWAPLSSSGKAMSSTSVHSLRYWNCKNVLTLCNWNCVNNYREPCTVQKYLRKFLFPSYLQEWCYVIVWPYVNDSNMKQYIRTSFPCYLIYYFTSKVQ